VTDIYIREGIRKQLVNLESYKKLALYKEVQSINSVVKEKLPRPHEVVLRLEIKRNREKRSGSSQSEREYIDLLEVELRELFQSKIIFNTTSTLRKVNYSKAGKQVNNGASFDLECRVSIESYEQLEDLYDFIIKEDQGFDKNCIIDLLGYSSGQYAKMTLFSKLFYESGCKSVMKMQRALNRASRYLLSKKNDNRMISSPEQLNENLLVLLDEGDMFFHPEWQRSFINDIRKLLNYAFKDHEVVKTIHLLVTSNSPFIMSDIPIEHSITLKCENLLEQTFAQNIHDILKSSFFMDSGTIGSIAEEHISEVIKQLNSELVFDEDGKLYRSIKMIGEPLIRFKLESMYEKKTSKSNKIRLIKEKIEALNKTLEELDESEGAS